MCSMRVNWLPKQVHFSEKMLSGKRIYLHFNFKIVDVLSSSPYTSDVWLRNLGSQ